MTLILSWNIQNGKGTDGEISLERVASVIREMAEPDVICLQEVSRHLELAPEGNEPDQVAQLLELFPGYDIIFGAAIEVGHGGGQLAQFGNATLTRLPVLSVFRHLLPQPALSGIRHMPRQATEITVAADGRALRVTNTHLEYHSQQQRHAQIGRLRGLHHEIVLNAMNPPEADAGGPYKFYSRPREGAYCGDFNMETDSEEYSAMLSPLPDMPIPFQDAWLIAHPGKSHAPTCGIYDHDQWPQGPHTRDYFFATDRIAGRIQDVTVNTVTNASDHQPLLLHLSRQ